MATLQELMSECFGEPVAGLNKGASAAKATTDEIDEVLNNLGISDSETVKVASESNEQNGGNMGLMDIYEQIMVGGDSAETSHQGYEGEASPSTQFGELVGEYFNVLAEPFFNKVAGDLEAEAGKGHQPMAGLGEAVKKYPHLEVNYDSKNGRPLEVSTGGSSPYSLKESALIKQILRRAAARQSGNVSE